MSKWDPRLIINRATDASSEPVTVAEAKAHLRVETTDDDTYITTLIKIARKHIEDICGISMISQTWDLWLNHFPNEIKIPRPPLISVTSITYTDTDGDSQTLATGVYTVDSDSDPGRIYEAYDQSFPSVRSIPKAIKVRFVSGFSATATGVDEDLKHAMLLLIGQWFENREPVVVGTIAAEIPMTVKSLLAPYKHRDF